MMTVFITRWIDIYGAGNSFKEEFLCLAAVMTLWADDQIHVDDEAGLRALQKNIGALRPFIFAETSEKMSLGFLTT